MRWHLFANGEFKVWIDYEKCSFEINGLASDTKELLLEPDLGWYLAKDCTLIARPISDMTDEEQEIWNRYRYHTPEGILDSPSSFRYLLENGIYPGPQSHFDDGTVIDGSKLEKA